MNPNENNDAGREKNQAGQNNAGQRQAGQNKNAGQNSSQENPFAGFDFSKFFAGNNKEIIHHLISGGGAVALCYFFFIKPLEEKLRSVTSESVELRMQFWEVRKKLRTLEYEHKKLLETLADKDKSDKAESEEYFRINRNRWGDPSQPRVIRM